MNTMAMLPIDDGNDDADADDNDDENDDNDGYG
jgi:hypothetical protein